MNPKPHKLIFYNDGRHVNLYQFEPPMAREQLHLVVDETVGTPIDTLFYCTGDCRTQLYATNVGERWGHNVSSWEHLVFHRAAQNARLLIEAGLDPMQVVCDRAHEKGLSFFPSFIVQNYRSEEDESGRQSDFWHDNPQFTIGPDPGLEPGSRHSTAFDFAHEAVREERFAIVDELVTNYPIDGIELEMRNYFPFFKPSEIEKNLPLLTDWIRRIRRRMDEVGAQRGQLIELAVRVPGTISACQKIGIDVEAWVREGLLNIVSPGTLDGDDQLMQQDLDLRPFVSLARGTGCQVNGVLGGMAHSDEATYATLAHYRAGAGNFWSQGVDGLLLPYFWAHWPYTSDTYAILRELTHPDVMAWGDKHYFVPTATPSYDPNNYFGYQRPLPLPLGRGQSAEATFTVTDDLGRAEAQGRLSGVSLHLRLVGAEYRDRYEVRLNGEALPENLLAKRDMTYFLRAPKYRAGFAYWLDYELDPHHWPKPGENRVSVTLQERVPELAVPVQLRDVELKVNYRPGRNWWRWDVAP